MLDVTGSIVGGQLHMNWLYSAHLHQEATIIGLAEQFVHHLRALIEHACSPEVGGYTPSDFPLARLSQEQIDQYLGQDRQVEAVYPLSPLQQGLLFHSLYAPNRGDYITQVGATFRGQLDVDAFRHSWQQVLDHHPILRTAFLWEGLDQPLQIVRRTVELAFVFYDWRAYSSQEQRARITDYWQTDRTQGFVLSEQPLMRLALFRLTEDTYEFLWSHHHLLLDGWSVPILLQDAFVGYEAFCSGREIRLEQPRQYQDYISWLIQQDRRKADTFWQHQLEGFTEPTLLSNDRVSFGAIASSEPAYEEQMLSLTVDISQKLQHLTRQHQLTLNTIVQGAWALLLSHYSRKQDVLFGVTVSGRPADLVGIEIMVGLFINTLPERIRIQPEVSLLSWLKALQEQFIEIRQYEYSPLAQIQDRSQVVPGTPLFEYLLVFENYPIDQTRVKTIGGQANLVIEELHAKEQTNYPLTLVVSPGQSLVFRALYDRQRFETATITRLLSHLQVILEHMLSGIEHELGRCSLVSAAEQEFLLRTLNATQTAYPREATIQALFEEQVSRTPYSLALVSAEGTLTYEQLNQRANQLAHYLRQQGIEPEALVGLCMERSAELIIAILGILKAGGAYLPLDPSYPKERLAFMLEDARTRVLITQNKYIEVLPAQGMDVICLDSEWEALSQEATENLDSEVKGHNLAYVMYTSGSTGRPKGVSIPHQAICRLVLHTNYVQLGPSDTVAQVSNAAFDAATFEIWGALLQGARLVVITNDVALSPLDFATGLGQQGITTMFLTTALFNQLASSVPRAFRSLRHLLFGGEAVDPRWVKEVLNSDPPERLLHVYGPTESTTFASWFLVQDVPVGATTLPIGHPLSNTQIYVLDTRLQPVPVGIPGELYIGGDGLARGYLHQPALTAERFIPHPWSTEPGQRLYRTGDLARYLPDGTIEFLGRLDRQVKIRGYRIELGEIENMLLQHPAVQNCVAVVREELSTKRIVAYVVLSPSASFESEELRGFLQERLPEYMVPAIFVVLEALPLNANGKVDRHALPDPDYTSHMRLSPLETASTPVEKALIDIWQQVLGVQEIGIQDNFFMLGGDSILSIQIISRAAQAGIHLTPKLIFEHPTIAELARALTNITAHPALEAIQGMVTGDVPLTPIQHWFFAQRQPQPHHWNQALLLSVKRSLDLNLLKQLVATLLEHHDVLRTRFIPEDAGWQQIIEPLDSAIPCSTYDLSLLPEMEQPIALEEIASEIQASLDLIHGPLLRFAYFDRGNNRSARLLIVIHHLIVDGVSWRVLLEDMNTAYAQLEAGLRVQLPAKTLSFQQWSRRLQIAAQDAAIRKELDYWLQVAKYQRAVLPVDWEDGRSRNTISSARSVAVSLTMEETQALLHDVPHAYRTQINDVLLTALAQGMAQWTRQPSLLIHLEGHGREGGIADVDLSRTVGWFTSLYPVVLDIGQSPSPGAALKTIKESLRAMASHGIGYGLLHYLSSDEQVLEQMRALPEAEISFNYLGQFDSVLSEDTLFNVVPEACGSVCSPLAQRQYLLEVNGSISGSQLYLNWTYSEHIHRHETIEMLARNVLEALRVLIAHCQLQEVGGYTPSDFPLARLTQEQIDATLGSDRRVEAVYPLSPLQQGMLFH
ncbi:MAG TPA: amino acid adenylation domain-containing protein, partial [Ktedonobacteraceae bacterium]|nr:amino acid adenylation domain-containing protein [Ktedonobacteraceae bacterium]